MVQVIGQNRTKPLSKGQQTAKGIGEAFETGKEYLQQYYQRQLMENENEAINKNYGINLTGITNPEARQQILINELQYGRKMKQAEASGKVPLTKNRSEDFLNQITRKPQQELPEFQTPGKNIPIPNQEPQNIEEVPYKLSKNRNKKNIPFSSIPQSETSGIKRPVFTPEQVFEEGHRIAEENRSNGVPMTDVEGVQQAQLVNSENRIYNADVDSDIKARQEAQIGYGNLAVEKLGNVYPNATDEEKALFRKKGQEIAEEVGNNEAKIDARLADEAKNLKNNISNVLKSPTAERLFNAPWRKVQGESRTFDQRSKDIRLKLEPILKEGLYPLARDLVSQLGYYPEEIERIVSNLSENANKSVAQLPKMNKIYESQSSKGKYGQWEEKFSDASYEKIKNNINQTFKNDPNVNLLLLRKAYEEKNVDWKTFKDILDEGILEGQIKLSPEQYYFKDNIDSPPLNNLDIILEGLNIKGR
jgi:hypothetical protein